MKRKFLYRSTIFHIFRRSNSLILGHLPGTEQFRISYFQAFNNLEIAGVSSTSTLDPTRALPQDSTRNSQCSIDPSCVGNMLCMLDKQWWVLTVPNSFKKSSPQNFWITPWQCKKALISNELYRKHSSLQLFYTS